MGMLGVAGRVALTKTGTSGPDVTPNAVNWTDGIGTIPTVSTGNGAQTISGINTTINLYYQQDFGDGLSINYSKNGGPWTNIAELALISISNNDTLDWQAQGSGGVQQIIIKNASDSDAILDYIYLELAIGG